MEYVCVNARFNFFNGKKNYTVEYGFGVQTWYVFEDQKTTDALWWKKMENKKSKLSIKAEAESILEEYLETVTA